MNQYAKFFHPKEEVWHKYAKGEYHISSIGCSHADLDPGEHYGPCLRALFFEYTNPMPKDDSSLGNFEMGNDIHEKFQKCYLYAHPATNVESVIYLDFNANGGERVKLKGKIDILDFSLGKLIDVKTASLYTFPREPLPNPTHVSQIRLYAYLANEFVFKDHPVNSHSIAYVKKHNYFTMEVPVEYDEDLNKECFVDFSERVKDFHDCLKHDEVPMPEPMKWCKYCNYKEDCDGFQD